MKLDLQKGDDRHGVPDFTPTELASLAKTKGIKVHTGTGVVIRYLVFNVKRAPTNNLAVRKAIAYLMPRQDDRDARLPRHVQPLYSMVPAGLPGHTDAFATLYGTAPNAREGEGSR